MDVDGMLARRQVLEIELDLHAAFAIAEHRGADALALGVLQFDGDGLARGL